MFTIVTQGGHRININSLTTCAIITVNTLMMATTSIVENYLPGNKRLFCSRSNRLEETDCMATNSQ